ncbi:MAG TPA: FkbM family methyltransferase [Bryobacteraceae bacterium]|nr:FkbM family methyltransferase [Bryobacteraceae bacterium]
MSSLKPEYIYQPGRLLGRLAGKNDRASKTALTGYGFPMDVMPDELISNSIRRKGMYDIVTAEAIYRLLDPKAHAIDAGAHVGLMSALMALRVGAEGRVSSFEPHPVVYAMLRANAARLNQAFGTEVIRTYNLALSDETRWATLYLPSDWAANTGVARLDAPPNAAAVETPVECGTLDESAIDERAELMKLDVEGHELAVLRGAPRMLTGVRDIVFEDFGTYPTPAMLLLEQQGFRVFALFRTLFRPILMGPDRRGMPEKADPNYLATRDPERARQRFKPSGWQVLRRLFPPHVAAPL